ncbi:MAG: hypothetical protein ATN31_07200 [Candidatus Epulonipiscioides saccharophilum]|nr:MAG: hypothetical protein ATN31_07200 [Epulopiscium sp. AS2M-Bin001]
MKTRDLTTGGVLVALAMILFYLANILTTSTITIFTLTLFIPIIAYLRCNLKTAIVVYLSSSFLGFALFSPILGVAYFILGSYGIIKSFIESKDNLILETVLKLITFTIMGIILLLIASPFMLPYLSEPIFGIGLAFPTDIYATSLVNVDDSTMGIFTTPVILVIFILIGFVVDYALTLLVQTYYKYFKNL